MSKEHFSQQTIIYLYFFTFARAKFSQNEGPAPWDVSLPVRHLCFQSFVKKAEAVHKAYFPKSQAQSKDFFNIPMIPPMLSSK